MPMKRLAILSIGVLLIALGLFERSGRSTGLAPSPVPQPTSSRQFGGRDADVGSVSVNATTPLRPAHRQEGDRIEGRAHEADAAFRTWMGVAADLHEADGAFLDRGVQLAVTRFKALEHLLHTDPKRLPPLMLTLGEWERLPAAIKGHVEVSFSDIGDLVVSCSCRWGDGENAHSSQSVELRLGGSRYPAILGEGWQETTSKEQIPLQGAFLHGNAIVQLGRFQPLLKPAANADPARIAATTSLSSDSLSMLIGGQPWLFESSEEHTEWEQRFRSFLRTISPQGGEYGFLGGGSKSGGAPLPETGSWSQTAKTVLLLRVGFADRASAPIDSDRLEGVMRRVSSHLDAESKGLVQIDAIIPDEALVLSEKRAFYGGADGEDVLADEALGLAAKAGIDFSRYDIVGFAFHKVWEFDWIGLASVGGRRLWLNGRFDETTLLHELGHNLGLKHASAWDGSDGTVLGGEGRHVEYGDVFDLMGAGEYPESGFHAHGLRRLGWLAEDAVVHIEHDGTYFISAALDSAPHCIASEALTLNGRDGRRYWVSYQKNRDQQALVRGGAYIQWQYRPDQCRLLDLTPDSRSRSSADLADALLAPGGRFVDPAGGFSVNLLELQRGGSSTHAIGVEVTFFPEGVVEPLLPADLDADRFISLEEFTRFASAWKAGEPWGSDRRQVGLEEFARVAAAWKLGRRY